MQYLVALATLVIATPLAIGLTPSATQKQEITPKIEARAEPASADVIVRRQLPSYPLKTCVVSDEPLGSMGAPIDHVIDGRLVRLCCKGCVKGVEKDKAAAIAKVDKGVLRAQGPGYPLKTCVVSGEALDPDDTHTEIVGTRLVRTCCGMCGKKVAKNPRAYIEKINAALIETQRKAYTKKTCPVSGEALGADTVDHLYGTQLVRLCCKSCVRVFEKSPATFLEEPAKK
jgi:hypothetical protein